MRDELSKWETDPLTYEGITISGVCNDASTIFAPYSRDMGDTRLYVESGDSFTFTAPSGKNFFKIEINGKLMNLNDANWSTQANGIVWSKTPSNTVTLTASPAYYSTNFTYVTSIVFYFEEDATDPSTDGLSGSGTTDSPYLIQSDDDWTEFCTNFDTYKAGVVKLTNDINVSTIAGTWNTTPFTGTFDGDGHTMTVSINDATTTQGAAPFRYIVGATIRNLVATGPAGARTHGVWDEEEENFRDGDMIE